MIIKSIDIETGPNANYTLFAPEFKEPRITKKGEPYASDKTIKEQQEEFAQDAALKAITGQCLCFSTCDETEDPMFFGGNSEMKLLQDFWDIYHNRPAPEMYLVGWNLEWDLEFMFQRSVILGVRHGINPLQIGWRMCIDLMLVWHRFRRSKKMDSLANFVKAVGVGEKDVHVQEHFYETWLTDKEKAIKYSMNDALIEYRGGSRLLSN